MQNIKKFLYDNDTDITLLRQYLNIFFESSFAKNGGK